MPRVPSASRTTIRDSPATSPAPAPGTRSLPQIAGLGAGQDRAAWRLEPEDARELSGLADTVVTPARGLGPDRCRSAAECFALTRDVRESVRLMIGSLRRPDLLDTDLVSPWLAAG